MVDCPAPCWHRKGGQEVPVAEAHVEPSLQLVLHCWSHCSATASFQAPLDVAVLACTTKPWPSLRLGLPEKRNSSFVLRKDLGAWQ